MFLQDFWQVFFAHNENVANSFAFRVYDSLANVCLVGCDPNFVQGYYTWPENGGTISQRLLDVHITNPLVEVEVRFIINKEGSQEFKWYTNAYDDCSNVPDDRCYACAEYPSCIKLFYTLETVMY